MWFPHQFVEVLAHDNIDSLYSNWWCYSSKRILRTYLVRYYYSKHKRDIALRVEKYRKTRPEAKVARRD